MRITRCKAGLSLGMLAFLSTSAQAVPLLDNDFETLSSAGTAIYYTGSQPLSWRFGGMDVTALVDQGFGPGTAINLASGFGAFPPATGQWLVLQSYFFQAAPPQPTDPTVSQTFNLVVASDLTLTLDLGGRLGGAQGGTGNFRAFLDPVLDGNGNYASGGQLFGFAPTTDGSTTAFTGTLTGVSSGAHTLALTFLGVAGDQSAFVDNVALADVPVAGVPEFNAYGACLPLLLVCGMLLLTESRPTKCLAGGQP